MNQVCCILISVDVDVSLQSFVENSFLWGCLCKHTENAACVLFSFHVKTPIQMT